MRHSVAVLAERDGRILASVRLNETLSLHTTDKRRLLDRFADILRELLGRANLPYFQALEQCLVCTGMSGVTFAYDSLQLLPGILGDFAAQFGGLICTGDAEVTFAAAAGSDTGSLIVSHTGSTAYVVGKDGDQLRHFRYGGWGPAIGDEGSGYWIGREGLRAIGEEYDSRAANSVLWEEIHIWLNHPGSGPLAWEIASNRWHIESARHRRGADTDALQDPRQLVYAFAHQACLDEDDDVWRKAVAGLAIPVIRAFRKGDLAAQDIVTRAVGHLARQHRRACEVAQEHGRLSQYTPVVMYGGILNHNRDVRMLLCKALEPHLGPGFTVLTPDNPETMRPALGALLFALGNSDPEHLSIPAQPIIDRVRGECRKSEFVGDLIND